MLVREFQHFIDGILPPETAIHGDAIGLHVASMRGEVERVLVCLEITDNVVCEARERSCDVILTFHPLIYKPLARLDRSERVSRIVSDLIQADISVLAVHTAFDAFPQGTNYVLARLLGLEPIGPLVPDANGVSGMGLLASCDLSYDELLERVATICGGPLRHTPAPSPNIHTVAIVCGSGMSFYQDVKRVMADVFITADVKYHDFHAAQGEVGLIDPGHFEMEQFVPAGLISALYTAMPHVTFVQSTTRTNPVQYYVPSSEQSMNFTSQL